MPKSKKRSEPKGEPSGVPGFKTGQIQGYAYNLNVYVLVEKNVTREGGSFRWVVYDRTTGKVLGFYYPDRRSYIRTQDAEGDYRKATDWRDALSAFRR